MNSFPKHLTDPTLVFGTGGLFEQRLDEFTPRPSQQKMAASVAQTIKDCGKLVVESGTGTGKTFAYLVPVIVSGKKTIISTGTKHLQEQIFYRDLPTVLSVLDVQINAQLLKGRSNYLCQYRHRQRSEQSDLIGRESKDSMDVIDQWAMTTRTGDIAEVSELPEDSPIWKNVTSTTDSCLGGKCPDFEKCHVNSARKKALSADIVVVNHHLYFSDLTLKSDGFGELLPKHEVVIFDEAHTISDIASHFFGFAVSSYQINDLLEDIREAEAKEKSGVKLAPLLSATTQACNNFAILMATIARKKGGTVSELLADFRNAKFDSALTELKAELVRLGEALSASAPAGEALLRCHERCQIVVNNLFTWEEETSSGSVRWLEASARMFRIHQTPLDISEHFRSHLNRPGTSWIFTSATLAVGGDFSMFNRQIGLIDASSECWQSPFEFESRSLLYLPHQIPDPRSAEYPKELAEIILEVTNVSRGRAFCLFTSYRMMDQVYDLIRDKIKWPILLQGLSSKKHLVEKFVSMGNAVLLGTSSFWEGVDVKGEALSCVIIDKLPFGSPGDPVFKARIEECANQGGAPFYDIQVPDAVITLKQGVGRLIRSEQDSGVMVICDSRLMTKSYGKIFLKSLPPMPVSRDFSAVERFYRNG